MKSKYKFVPLRLQIENSSNATIQVICHLTKKKMKWNEAARAGWVSDCNGIPFDSYYCPEAVAQLKQNRK